MTPDVIELEFSEVDRQTAERYNDNDDCIVATALKNRGHNVVGVYTNRVYLDTGTYVCDEILYDDVCWRGGTSKPLYDEAVVGKKIRLMREGAPSAPVAEAFKQRALPEEALA